MGNRYILIYLTKCIGRWSRYFAWRRKQILSRQFKRDTEGSSSAEGSSKTTSTRASLIPLLHWRQTSLRKFKRSPGKNVLSTNLHTAFKIASYWTADIWSMNSRVPLDIFGSSLRLNSCRTKMLSFHLSINVIIITLSSLGLLHLCLTIFV